MKEFRIFLMLFTLILLSILTLILNIQMSLSEDQPQVIWTHLLLVYPSTDVAYLEDSEAHTFRGNMSDELQTTVIDAFKNLPNLIKDGSDGIVSSTYEIIVAPHPVTHITMLQNGFYWLSPQDISEDLALYAPEGKYDSVHAVWYSGPIKVYWGLGGVFVNNGTSTFSSIVAGEVWWWMDGAFGEIFLHEWLHGVCRFYEKLGYLMPEADADGGELHGYSKSPTEGWMPYYRDLMRGMVWEPKISKYTGITREAWARVTPRLIPEFPSAVIISFFMLFTIFAAIFVRKICKTKYSYFFVQCLIQT